ncbi:MAG TPA: ABC transporter ATP-binding protein [Steroidobacteraceae bacterium]|nr:ABC transporter ATP-binding protein [Steroidobacteraceae bacterium]
MGTGALLEVESLAVSIGSARIVHGVSLQIAAGEILGLVGASGSGKSTLALALMRLLPPGARASGAVRLEGRSISAMSEAELQSVRGRQVGMVFQEPMSALNPLLRIGEQVAETVRLHGRASRRQARSLAREALDRVGLQGEDGALDRLPHELSGGQRQRVALAIALVLSPSLLIADEPTTALDVATQAQVLALLRHLARSLKVGILLVSHDLAVIAQVTDRIAVLERGEIVEQMATADLLGRAHHPYTQALLRAARLEPKRTRRDFAHAALVLEARDIVREYPRARRSLRRRPSPLRAVDGVSVAVHAGETVGVVGESGSGKSSLLRVLLALDRPQGGEVRLLGENFSGARGAALRRLRRSIQVVLQDPAGSFDPRWRVERLVAEPSHVLEEPPSGAALGARVSAALEQVGLPAAAGARYAHQFSGGERQRIAIARALILEPAVIAFDEAVSALDVVVRAQILSLLAELAERLELAYLFVSHDLQVVRAIADRVYVMQRGRIVEEGPAERVLRSPRHPYTRSLIEATPQLGAPLAGTGC